MTKHYNEVLYNKMLRHASYRGDLQQVEHSLDQGASINHQFKCHDALLSYHTLTNSWKLSSLQYSIIAGHLKIVDCLLERGADIAQRNEIGYSALQLALFQPYSNDINVAYEIISSLQRHNTTFEADIFKQAYQGKVDVLPTNLTPSNINQTDSQGYSVLHYACASGSLQTVQTLVMQQATLNLKSKHDKTTPLLVAVQWGHIRIVNYLLENGANIADRNSANQTIFLIAALYGHLNIIEQLWKQDSNLMLAKDKEENTAFHLAAYSAHLEVIKWLTDKDETDETDGTDQLFYKKNRYDITVLIVASIKGHFPIVQWLVEYDTTMVGAYDSEGRGPLLHAIWAGHLEIARWLLPYGFNNMVMVMDDIGLLEHAAWGGQLPMLKWLLLSMNFSIEQRRKAILRASKVGHLDIVKYLVTQGVSIRDTQGTEALSLAAAYNNLHIVKWLVTQGVSIQGAQGTKALSLAAHHNSWYTLTWLVEHGTLINKELLTTKKRPVPNSKVRDYLQKIIQLRQAAYQFLKYLRPIKGNLDNLVRGKLEDIVENKLDNLAMEKLNNLAKKFPLEMHFYILQYAANNAQVLSLKQCESILNYAQDRSTLQESQEHFLREAVHNYCINVSASIDCMGIKRETPYEEVLPNKKSKLAESYDNKQETCLAEASKETLAKGY